LRRRAPAPAPSTRAAALCHDGAIKALHKTITSQRERKKILQRSDAIQHARRSLTPPPPQLEPWTVS